MNKNLEKNTYKFEFFNKQRKNIRMKLEDFLLFFLGILLAFFMAGRICSNSFDSQLTSYINWQTTISETSVDSFKSLSENLIKKNWTTVQYDLLMLRSLNSIQIDQKVLTALTDYSIDNFKEKTYSDEFALLITSYLSSMQMVSSKEQKRITDMNQILGNPLMLDLYIMEATFKEQSNIFNKKIIDIKEKSTYLIKNLKETPLKKRLIESFGTM